MFVFIDDNKFVEKKDVVLEIYLKLNLSQEGREKKTPTLPLSWKVPLTGVNLFGGV